MLTLAYSANYLIELTSELLYLFFIVSYFNSHQEYKMLWIQ